MSVRQSQSPGASRTYGESSRTLMRWRSETCQLRQSWDPTPMSQRSKAYPTRRMDGSLLILMSRTNVVRPRRRHSRSCPRRLRWDAGGGSCATPGKRHGEMIQGYWLRRRSMSPTCPSRQGAATASPTGGLQGWGDWYGGPGGGGGGPGTGAGGGAGAHWHSGRAQGSR